MRRTRLSHYRYAAIPIALLLTVLSAPAGAVETVSPSNRPTPLEGRTNGRLPASDLVTVVPGCAVARDAAPSLYRLFALARASNVALTARDCYRPLTEQVSVARSWTARGNSACAARVAATPSGQPVGTSMHGWGKAVDFGDGGAAMRFGSRGYRFLKSNAAALGWNHPGWAEPGGSACPEAWHWEWVGDGGSLRAAPVRADVVALLPAPGDDGYAVVTGLGAVRHAGASTDRGAIGASPLSWVVITAASTPSGSGYWLVAADGGVFTFGDAVFHGSTGDRRLNAPIVAAAATPSGNGYWLIAADGGVFTFGDAGYFGSTAAAPLNAPVVAMAPSASGRGYRMVASDGGIFTFGDATFEGSAGALDLRAPIVAIAPTSSGLGYWLAGADGGVFAYGDAEFFGAG